MSNRIDLNVFLRGERNYVQGTQIIARVAEIIPYDSTVLVQASFFRISKNNIYVMHDCADDREIFGKIGSVSFKLSDQIFAYDIYESMDLAPRLDSVMPISVSYVSGSLSSSAIYNFSGVDKFEDVLNVLVQSIKHCHERISDRVYDIWLTGVRGFSLPIHDKNFPSSGSVYFNKNRITCFGLQYQSMVVVDLKDTRGNVFNRGYISFAFKSKEAINVD